MFIKPFKTFFCAAIVTLSATRSPAGINVYLSPPDVEDSAIATDTLDFNSAPLGTDYSESTDIGFYSGKGVIIANDQYGGFNEGRYLAVTTGNSVTINLDLNPILPGSTDAYYFGLYFTAGDGFNTFEIKSHGTTLGLFNTQNLLDKIPNTFGTTIVSLDNTVYNTRDYYGQPVSGSNGGEPYAYLNIVASEGTTFDEIIISQAPGAGGARFESDNHSISSSPITSLPGNFIDVTDSVPEASSAGLSLSSLGLLALRRARK